MTIDKTDIHHRRSVRMRGYDYSQAGAYLVTICTKDREHLLGIIQNGEMILNDVGQVIHSIGDTLPRRFPSVKLDSFAIMPNHVHLIIIVGAQFIAPLKKGVINHAPTLGEVIRAFKAAATYQIRKRIAPSFRWQRNYHERIIRNESELQQLRQYINQNPVRWAEDEYNPAFNDTSVRAQHAAPLPTRKRGGTRTSPFGSPGRINHDSTAFYASRLYQGLPKEEKVEFRENTVPPENLDQIFAKSSEQMEELPDDSVHLMVTSPPYNVGKEYDEDLTLDEYRAFLKRVWAEVKRVLVPGGRACINIANLGRKPYLPINTFIVQDMLDLGFLQRGEIIWNKAASGSPSTAWGSWLSAKNPILRDVHEYIMVFSNGAFSRQDMGRKSTISRDQFLEYTKSVWTFPAEPATKVGHPAPFPVELPYRLIQLYTFEDEVILDPFAGSGQAAIAALKANRHYVGYEIDVNYAKLARKRIGDFLASLDQTNLLELEKNGQR